MSHGAERKTAMEPVYLRALELDDLDRTYKWHNDQELYRTLGGIFRYVSRATEEEWLRKKQAYDPQEVNLAICLTDNSQHIGNIYLRNINWIARHGEVHVFIGESGERSKGYGAVALRLMIEYAFHNLGLLRLYLFILEGNTSIKLAEKFGFVLEGRLRKHAFKDGQFKDVLVVGLCASDLPSGGL
jgi:RimJ/RimL family protein N-acetyltransferase